MEMNRWLMLVAHVWLLLFVLIAMLVDGPSTPHSPTLIDIYHRLLSIIYLVFAFGGHVSLILLRTYLIK